MSSSSSSNPSLFLLFSILIAILSVPASARHCKTLFISSYSFSIRPIYLNPNPNHVSSSSSGFVTIVTQITQRGSSEILLDGGIFDDSKPRDIRRDSEPFGLSSYDMTSLRDRTKDILSVVVALLFGVGCGALTAATMYLVWSLFANRYGYQSSYDFDDYESEEADESPKKMSYVKIPQADAVKAAV